MKLLFFTDTHIRGNNPENRIDNLGEALKAKIEEILEIAYRYQVDYILHGGDFFDMPSPSLAVTGEFLELFQQFTVPIYAISGNHDVFGGNLISLPRTLLGFIGRLGFIKLLTPGEKVYLEKHNTRVQLTGQSYHYEMDRREAQFDYQVQKEASDIAIHMVHGMLADYRDFPGDVTLIDDILTTGADITLSGHNHLGFGVIEKNHKLFVNPGALVRLSNHQREISREVGVALISLEGKKIESRIIPLQCALPGAEVLDRSKIDEQAALSHKLEMFAQEIRQATNLEKLNVQSIIEEVAASLGESPQVKHEALQRIALAEEALLFREEQGR